MTEVYDSQQTIVLIYLNLCMYIYIYKTNIRNLHGHTYTNIIHNHVSIQPVCT